MLGGEVEDEHDGWFVRVRLDGELSLAVQKVEDPTPGTRRLHLDLASDDLDAETERLVGLGARVLAHHADQGPLPWTVFTDPDGNEFCVAAPA